MGGHDRFCAFLELYERGDPPLSCDFIFHKIGDWLVFLAFVLMEKDGDRPTLKQGVSYSIQSTKGPCDDTPQVQGHLAHKKPPPPGTLQQDHA